MKEYKILPPVIERGIYKHRLVERNGMMGFYETYLLRNPDHSLRILRCSHNS